MSLRSSFLNSTILLDMVYHNAMIQSIRLSYFHRDAKSNIDIGKLAQLEFSNQSIESCRLNGRHFNRQELYKIYDYKDRWATSNFVCTANIYRGVQLLWYDLQRLCRA